MKAPKNLGGPWPLGVKEERGPRSEGIRKFFDHVLFSLRKRPYSRTEIDFSYTHNFVNESAKMKDNRKNCREIRVQNDNITGNTNARSPLTFRNLP